ncbi:MAG: OmpA family protein [Acidobacteriota bacterium]
MVRSPLIVTLALVVAAPAAVAPGVEQVNLLSIHEGTFPVIAPEHYGGWPVEALLDASPRSGWACPEGKTAGNVFVFEMIAEAVIERFEFDTAGIDEEGAAAKEVVVEVSTTSRATGFTPVLRASLAAKADGQKFAAQGRVPARWVRLSILSNHGSEGWVELFSLRGFGALPPMAALPSAISGTYDSSYSLFRVRQQGSALAGCYEYNEGLLTGTIEGRVMKLTWREGDNHGPAVMVFAPDGSGFRGYYWHAGAETEAPAGEWAGTKQSATVGTCPHWSGSVAGELEKTLVASGRARLYGILFDLDSATLRGESKTVLDEVVRVLEGQPGWKLAIEGHTDSTGADAHNQALSQQRAESVRSYLTGKGAAAARLRAVGFGESKPVADNATELGRAQNRRVELVRE